MTTAQWTTPGTVLWTLPANIDVSTPITIQLEGASDRYLATPGGLVVGTYDISALTPGVSQLQVNVGGAPGPWSLSGGSAGGFNGGGDGGTSPNGYPSLGGAGATDIRVGGTGLANRIAVAGGAGGGGGASWGTGGTGAAGGKGGAATGQAGVNGTGTGGGNGGGGGTAAAGGARGTPRGTASDNATAGASGVGGHGSNHTTSGFTSGGGGGGGYFGGGGGGGGDTNGLGAGGGGGSNYTGGLTAVTTNTQGGSATGMDGRAIITYNAIPNAPFVSTITNRDNTAGFQIGWSFTDPDPGDTQSKVDIRWRVGTGAWTTITSAVVGSGTLYTFAAHAFDAQVGQTVELQVRTYDSHSAVSPWSSSTFFTPRNEDATVPTITAPTSPFTTQTPQVVLASAAAFRYYQIQVTDTTTSTVIYTSLWIDAGASVTSVTKTLGSAAYISGRTYSFQGRTSLYNNNPVPGPYSAGASSTASINAPPVPTVSLIPDPASASMSVVIVNPAGGANPAVSNRVYRTDLTNNTPEQRIATAVAVNGTFIDWQAALNVQYSYRVEAVAANGNATSST